MPSTDPAKPLLDLLAALAARYPDPPAEDPSLPPAPPRSESVVSELVRAVLAWEAGEEHAAWALGQFGLHFVDGNELRVATPDDVAAVLGPDYPRAHERAERLHLALNAVFLRENGLVLEHMRDLPKRDARAYFDALPGVPPFAIARVMLRALAAHAVPVDDRLGALIRREGAADADDTADAIAGRLERAVRSGEALGAYTLLERWAADGGRPIKPAGRSRGGSKPAGAAKPARPAGASKRPSRASKAQSKGQPST